MTQTDAKQQFRMSWKDLQSFLARWEKYRSSGISAYSTFQETSSIYASFNTEKDMVRSRTLCPQAKKEGVEKSIEGLVFLKGVPPLLLNQAAARTLSRKRGGVRPSVKWRKYRVIYDEHGALLLPKEEIPFDMELSDALLAKYKEALEKSNKREEAAAEAEAKEKQNDSTDTEGQGKEGSTDTEDPQSNRDSTVSDTDGETPTDK